MANWWDAAPLAPQSAAPEAGANWWEAAPLANFDGRFAGEGSAPENPALESALKNEASRRSPTLANAITDIPSEIGRAASEAIKTIGGVANRGQQGAIEGFVNSGKAALGVPQLLLSPLTGATRSLIGHPMAQAEHAVGTLINPEVAAKDNLRAMYETAAGDVDTALTAVASRSPSAAATKAARKAAPTVDELKTAARKGFEAPEVEALEISAPTMKNFAESTRNALQKAGFDPELAPEVHKIISRLDNAPKDAFVSGQNIQSLRRVLGKAAESPDPTKRAAASAAIDALDDFLPTVAQNQIRNGDLDAAVRTLADARANWSAAKHAEMLDRKMIQAELRAAAANSGRNVSNTIRQRMADILIDPKKHRGFSNEALQQMQTIVEGTRGQNALRAVGNILGGGGGLGALASAAVGVGTTGGIAGLALPATGFAMRAMSNKMTINQAAKLSELVRSNSPLASSMAKFEEAASGFASQRNAKTIAGAVIAARNLSMNLRGAGLNVSPSELIAGIQSPGSSDADEQQ